MTRRIGQDKGWNQRIEQDVITCPGEQIAADDSDKQCYTKDPETPVTMNGVPCQCCAADRNDPSATDASRPPAIFISFIHLFSKIIYGEFPN